MRTAFLSEDGVVGPLGPDHLDDGRLRRPVRSRHEVVSAGLDIGPYLAPGDNRGDRRRSRSRRP
jgi:hypothetical protein